MNKELDTEILKKYKDPVIRELKRLAEARMLTEICNEKLDGLNPVRLTEIHQGKRDLTSYYLSKLLHGGVVTIDQILQGRKIDELPKADQVVIRRLLISDEVVELIAQLEELGHDVKQVLTALIPNNKKM